MIKSMTGYGKAEVAHEISRTIVEIRSVNHRYGEVSVKLPRALLQYENEVRRCVAERVKRGKIEVFVQREELAGENFNPVLNINLAKAYYDSFNGMKETLGIDDKITLGLIVAQKGVLVAAESGSEEGDARQTELLTVVRKAVDSLDNMRMREGDALAADMKARREVLAVLIAKVAQRTPEAVKANACRLKERVTMLVGETAMDAARLAQEVAVLADRSDITEELVRFNSHLQQFDATFLLAEPVGRKLDFLLQELNREVNTIGSKANDAEIATFVVELKAELEKIREQVQNIE